MRKIIQNFKEGLNMYSKSLYGDINLLHNEEDDENKKVMRNRKHPKKSRAHLRLVK